MKRRKFITLIGGAAAAWPLAARAQQPQHRHFRIGWLVFGGAALGVALKERGLIDARNIELIFRYANGVPTQLGDLAAGLVADRPDILIGVGGDVVKALFEASKGSIPIIGGVSDDPVRAGIAISLARPGKNFTGEVNGRAGLIQFQPPTCERSHTYEDQRRNHCRGTHRASLAGLYDTRGDQAVERRV